MSNSRSNSFDEESQRNDERQQQSIMIYDSKQHRGGGNRGIPRNEALIPHETDSLAEKQGMSQEWFGRGCAPYKCKGKLAFNQKVSKGRGHFKRKTISWKSEVGTLRANKDAEMMGMHYTGLLNEENHGEAGENIHSSLLNGTDMESPVLDSVKKTIRKRK